MYIHPTAEQRANYGNFLAPLLLKRMENNPGLTTGGGPLGDQGQPIDERLGEEVLQKKERDQGPSYFQLQHMLNTTLSDKDRYPLKVEQLVLMPFQGFDRFPLTLSPGYARTTKKKPAAKWIIRILVFVEIKGLEKH